MAGNERLAGRLGRRLSALVAAGLILGCGTGPAGTASPAPSAAASPAATSAPLDLSLVDTVFPRLASGGYGVCGIDGSTTSCPYTDRLRARLAAAGVTLCRCQAPARDRSASIRSTPSGGSVVVIYGEQQFELTVVSSAGRWLVDDETCLGGSPSTSIYQGAQPCRSG